MGPAARRSRGRSEDPDECWRHGAALPPLFVARPRDADPAALSAGLAARSSNGGNMPAARRYARSPSHLAAAARTASLGLEGLLLGWPIASRLLTGGARRTALPAAADASGHLTGATILLSEPDGGPAPLPSPRSFTLESSDYGVTTSRRSPIGLGSTMVPDLSMKSLVVADGTGRDG